MSDITNELNSLDENAHNEIIKFLEYAGCFNEKTLIILKNYRVISEWMSGKLDTDEPESSDEEFDFGIND